jgi:beta-lactam-binding protein with PASTA domain
MNIEDIKKKVFSRYLLLHLAAMAAAVVLLCVGVAFGLDIYTHHGEGIEVIDMKGMDFEEAYRRLKAQGLELVVSDSGYNKQLPADAILAQNPAAGHRVKEGRIVYVTVNSPSSPTFVIPDIVDNCSVREAEAKLTAIGFRLDPVMEVDGEKDWVYGILCRGRHVANGDRVSIDHPLRLMVGRGTVDDMTDMEVADGEEEPQQEGGTDDFQEVTQP